MNTLSLTLPNIRPYSIGFDRIFDDLSRNLRMADKQTFPPYDVDLYEATGDYDEFYTITMALAGFRREDIDITLADNCLMIKSNEHYEAGEQFDPHLSNNLHQGIAWRKFTRSFQIADDVLVKSAQMSDGMLRITLERMIPEEKKPKTIEVQPYTKSPVIEEQST